MAFVPSSSSGGGGGSGTVTSVSSANTSVSVANATTTPALTVATLDVLATNGPPVAAVNVNGQKVTGIANGTLTTDAAAFGQIPAALPPNGTASGDLSGTYPSPKVAKITETSGPTDLTIGTVTDGQYLKRTGTTLVSGAPVASVDATDASIVVAGTAIAPTVATGTLDVIATQHPPAASVAMNSQKLTGLAAGTGNGDSVRFEQLATAGPISTVFTRTGAVVAASGDYTAAQVTNAADKSSASSQGFTAGITSAHATQGVGYATGAGGAVTQLTSRTTAVTINKISGAITTHTASLASAAATSFSVSNSAVAAGDVVVVTCRNDAFGGGTAFGPYAAQVAAGSFVIAYTNNAAGAVTTAFVFNFVVIKGVSA